MTSLSTLELAADDLFAGFVTVRQATEGDRTALGQMFARCSRDTRYRRFHGYVKALPGRYLTEALSGSPAHFALVASVAADPRADPADGAVVALASCRAADHGGAEIGVLVEDAWQRHGIGGALLREIVRHAYRTGISLLTAQILAEQSWIVPLLAEFGDCESAITEGIIDVTVRLASAASVSA
jgi:GNAT superfamily N-acetyltransferase